MDSLRPSETDVTAADGRTRAGARAGRAVAMRDPGERHVAATGGRLDAPAAGSWARALEGTARCWATVLPCGQGLAVIEVRRRERPRLLCAVLRTAHDAEAALVALRRPGGGADDLPPAVRVDPAHWRRLSGAVEPMRPVPTTTPAPPAPAPSDSAEASGAIIAPVLRFTPATERARRARAASATALRARATRLPGAGGPVTPEVDPALRRRLVALRTSAGVGQRALAARLHVSRSYLAEVERGRRAGATAAAVAQRGVALLGQAAGRGEPEAVHL